MDWVGLVNLLTAIMILKAVEQIGTSSGQVLFETLRHKGEGLIHALRGIFNNNKDDQGLETLNKFEQDPQNFQPALVESLRKESVDAETTRQLSKIAKDSRNIIFDMLEQRFTENDLDKIALKLGFPPGELYSSRATTSERALAILNKIERQRRYPELVNTIYEVNPYI